MSESTSFLRVCLAAAAVDVAYGQVMNQFGNFDCYELQLGGAWILVVTPPVTLGDSQAGGIRFCSAENDPADWTLEFMPALGPGEEGAYDFSWEGEVDPDLANPKALAMYCMVGEGRCDEARISNRARLDALLVRTGRMEVPDLRMALDLAQAVVPDVTVPDTERATLFMTGAADMLPSAGSVGESVGDPTMPMGGGSANGSAGAVASGMTPFSVVLHLAAVGMAAFVGWLIFFR